MFEQRPESSAAGRNAFRLGTLVLTGIGAFTTLQTRATLAETKLAILQQIQLSAEKSEMRFTTREVFILLQARVANIEERIFERPRKEKRHE